MLLNNNQKTNPATYKLTIFVFQKILRNITWCKQVLGMLGTFVIAGTHIIKFIYCL